MAGAWQKVKEEWDAQQEEGILAQFLKHEEINWDQDQLLMEQLIDLVAIGYNLHLQYQGTAHYSTNSMNADELRLVDGGSPCAGRVEVKHQDQWGTVCDDGWDMADAGVVCPGELRLADGGSPCAGRVEVKHQDRWGTVCSDRWDMADAGVVCKQLGCGVAVSAHHNAHFGRGSGQIWLDEVDCDGSESVLWHCGNEGFGENDCGHGEDAGVTCSEGRDSSLRLADGGSPCAGRVEVKHQDRWGTVCSYRWDVTDAGVVCKQLGCGAAVGAPGWGHFGAGSGPIWLDDVACDGTESALWHCRNSGWEINYCVHDYDAGVTCSDCNNVSISQVLRNLLMIPNLKKNESPDNFALRIIGAHKPLHRNKLMVPKEELHQWQDM
ncbi:scavenger receptor cysteine-rich type 1 protein M130-like [Eretmochelys imbricata]